jgi:probable rRNA maturation factor
MNDQPEGAPRLQRRVSVNNRQHDCPIHGVRLRRLIRHLLNTQLGRARYDLAIHLISARRMARENEAHLNHAGPTDVITFDYAEPGDDGLVGELLICPAVAADQARRYATRWETEVVRYVVHGILHLQGYDDRTPAARRRMKQAEDHHLGTLLAQHPAREIRKSSKR